jgi:serine/threonine protein kinase
VIGRQVSHFYILRTLGSGGMGIVYEAQDTRLPRSVAIKFLKPALLDSLDALRRFKREARLASSLNHPNICTILEVDEGESGSFIAMELLQGRSLKARLSTGRLALDEILSIASQTADALAAAHDQAIIHRDITPGNIFLTDTGLVKLLDFGLAKYVPSSGLDVESSDTVTAPGAVAGTIRYMAPERLAEDASVDFRCDLFSLGAVLYEMATGAPPFDMSPRSALIAMIREQAPVPMRRLAPHHPVEFERLVARLLAKHPDDRYQSARELRAILLRLEAGARKSTTVAAGPAPVAGSSLAVLRFEILGGSDEAGETFRDGIAEDISSRLSALKDLRVASRTSTRNLSGRSLRDIAAGLDVTMILEGTIEHTGGRVQVTANLVDAASGRLLMPGATIERPYVDALTTQDEVTEAVCHALSGVLARVSRSHHAPEADAYQAYQRGLHYWRDCYGEGWRLAIDHFEYAIDRDPEFAAAHVALANAYNFSGFYSLIKPGLSFSVAARSAARAVAIDGELASAFRELALARFGGEWDWDGSEDAFRRALALDPDDALAHVHYSWLLMLLGREDAAYAEAQRAHGLAPSSRLVATARAQTLYIGGRTREAIEICDACVASDPSYLFAVQLRGLCHLSAGSHDVAVADLEQAAALSRRAPHYLGLLGRCYGQFGMRAEALALVAELERRSQDTYVPPQCYVFIYAGLGEHARALAYQEAAYLDGASPFNYFTPIIRGLYALDPYHKGRLEQMRLSL